MKYNLTEDHQVRLSEVVLKAGVYTLEELQEAHKHDSLKFCMEHTKLGKKLIPIVEESSREVKISSAKTRKNKK